MGTVKARAEAGQRLRVVCLPHDIVARLGGEGRGSTNLTRCNTAHAHAKREDVVLSQHWRSAWTRPTLRKRTNLTVDGQKIAPRDAHCEKHGCQLDTTPASPHPSALNIDRRCARGRGFGDDTDKELQH